MKKKSLTAFALIMILFLISLLALSSGINGISSKQQISKDSELHNLRTSASGCGIVICDVYYSQFNPKICSSGSGDAIIAWLDYRGGNMGEIDIYAQKISPNGNDYWLDNGIMILNSTKLNMYMQMCSDGMGGAIMTWGQYVLITESSIRAQRIDSNGNILWNSSGVLVSSGDDIVLEDPHICSDGAEGAIVVWYNDDTNSIHAQRIDGNGDLLWPTNGVTVCLEHCTNPRICSDGAGGVIITWIDSRHYATNDRDIYAQRIDLNGNVMWGTNYGIAICNTTDYQNNVRICSDGAGGAIITWEDARQGEYVQRVDSNGNYLWGNNGSRFCENDGYEPSIISDGQNGAIITLCGYVQGTIPMMYAQKIDSNYNRLWGINGTIIYTGVYMDKYPHYPQICTDQGAAIISWQVINYDTDTYDVFAQKLSAMGNLIWSPNGATICIKASDTGREPYPEICNDGSGGAFITWMHDDNWSADIRAQRIISDGSFPWTDTTKIPFGSIYIFWIIISVISLIVIVNRKNLKYINKN
ncbi:MAG: hypothetical protein ACFFCI_04245 [Promethearchaeota archaeon]